MMNIYRYPKKEEWKEITERPHLDVSQLNKTVENVLADIKANGDAAVKHYEQLFDHVNLESLAVSEVEMQEAEKMVGDELRHALELAHDNISKFHSSQAFESRRIETCKGVVCWQKSIAIEKVGLYIPGGTAPH